MYIENVTPNTSPVASPAAYQPIAPENTKAADGAKKLMGAATCYTCENRRYQDVSSDPGVSFQTPQHVSPEASFAMVRAHEMEHVTRDRADAERNGGEVISQSVSYHMGTCGECGKAYMAGGETRTVTKYGGNQDRNPNLDPSKGKLFRLYA